MIERWKRVNNPISRVVDFWVDSILEGYITEFVVDTITSYSEAERKTNFRTTQQIPVIFKDVDKNDFM